MLDDHRPAGKMNSIDESQATPSNSALILIDIQDDFLRGSLKVNQAEAILPTTYQLLQPSFEWKAVIASQDYHPPNHVSFASTHGRQPFTQIIMEPELERLDLWPEHCVQGTQGCELEPGVKERLDKLRAMGREVFVIKKGTEITKETYSAFRDDDDPELDSYLKSRAIQNLFCIGIAGDYCVKETVKSALKRDYRVFWISSGIASVGGPIRQVELEREFLQKSQLGTFQLIDLPSIQRLFA